VRAEDVGDGAGRGEGGEAGDARAEGGPVGDVEAAGVERVAGEEEARARVVDGDGGGFVARDWDDLELPVAEVERDDLLRPALDGEERGDGLGGVADDRGRGLVLELGVAGDVLLSRKIHVAAS
jgi:hypothetical protein